MAFALPVVLALACGGTTQTEANLTPSLPKGWNEISTGGDTICARGTPYSFFVNPGTSNKVLIDFQGGGACWTKESCSLAGSLFFDSIDTLREQVANGFPGIYDRDRAGNPLTDAFHVVVPYCTGDIHWGNATVDYGDATTPLVIRHRGAVNARAVLDWVYKNFPKPEQVTVMGCSAGSYGSIYWAPDVARHYAGVDVQQFGDSGAGVVTDTFFHDSFPQWNATSLAPDFIPALDPKTVDWQALSIVDLYSRVGAFFPHMLFAQFNDSTDSTQSFFYTAMGGNSAQWSAKMFATMDAIHASTPNFRSYIGKGDQHCVIPNDDYATFTSGGVKFVDWFEKLRQGQDPGNVECEGCRP
ncbi:MAG: pectinesterase [Deltaproteobacteria bacterium]|nr:pectinesterase [Deltaproteobacteria bacterium]